MAMSCLAFPEAGQPNLRARRNSAAVDSGMPERSSLLSGIGFALLAGRLARADDADDFLAIFHLPGSVNERGIREIPHCAGRPLRPAKPSGTQNARRSEAGRKNRPASFGMTVGGILFRDDANREIGVPGWVRRLFGI